MFTSTVVSFVVRNTIFRKAPPSRVSGYGERSIDLNKVVATFEKHTFLSQTDLTRTGIISNSFFPPEFNIRLYDKNSESNKKIFLHQNQNIFSATLGIRIFFQKTSCLPIVGGSLWVLQLLPPLKLVTMIQPKYC